MDMIKSTARGLHFAKAFFTDSTYVTVMNRLIVVFVSREEWSTATAVIESDCKSANLISISLVESSHFWCRLYHRASTLSVNCGHRERKSIFNFMFTEKYSALSVPLSHGTPPLSPKTTNKTSLLVEEL